MESLFVNEKDLFATEQNRVPLISILTINGLQRNEDEVLFSRINEKVNTLVSLRASDTGYSPTDR